MATTLAMLVHGAASAAVRWTLTVTPLSTPALRATTFTMTASNLDALRELGCVKVDLTSAFAVGSVKVGTVSNGGEWLASSAGSVVAVRARDGGDRLRSDSALAPTEWVQFTVVATASAPGIVTWQGTAWEQQDCSGSPFLDVLPVLITVTAASPTSTPTPSSATILPTLPPSDDLGVGDIISGASTPAPVIGRLVPTATPAPVPADRSTGPPAAAPGGAPPPAAPGSSGGPAGEAPVGPVSLALAPPLGPSAGIGIDLFDGFGTLGDNLLLATVPTLVLGVPGLLIVVLIGIQLAGAVAWIPVARRFRRAERVFGPGLVSRTGGAPSGEARLDRWTRMAWR